ncbi:MAG: endonuclease domain-containing protein [Candidatus Falkowbacteria bacterium]
MHKITKVITAQEFRKKPTISERVMWNALRNRQFLNLKFRRQHVIRGYIVDFFCAELKLAVEIDGPVHADIEQKQYDRERQADLENLSINFFRITDDEVERNIGRALEKLYLFINKL